MNHAWEPFAFRLPAFFRPWMLLPALLLICLQTTWLGIRLAAGASPGPRTALVLPVPTAGDGAGINSHMTSAQCLSCHQTEPVLSHPVKTLPTMLMPAAFPLEDGQINCITCHQDTFAEHAAAVASGHAGLLRGAETGQAFCAQCHTQESLSRQSQHPFAISQAHLVWPKTSRVVSANPPTPTRDNGVSSCLSCHDGTIAPDAFGGLMGKAFSMDGSKPGHPVGVAYPLATLRHGDAVFKAAGAIDPRVRLTGGQVTCNSCHSLYSHEPGLMVMRNDNSALCMSCHAQ